MTLGEEGASPAGSSAVPLEGGMGGKTAGGALSQPDTQNAQSR